MGSDWYRLNEKNEVCPVGGVDELIAYYEAYRNLNPRTTASERDIGFEAGTWRRVAETNVWFGLIRVSTVFLGLDHGWGEGPPLVFETMSFPVCRYGEPVCRRYSTWDEAVAGHNEVVRDAWLKPWQGVSTYGLFSYETRKRLRAIKKFLATKIVWR